MPLYLSSPPQFDGLKMIFEAGHRIWRVRVVMVFLLVFCVTGLLAAYYVIGVATFEGEAVSFVERMALAAFCAVPALAFVIGMDIYARCYVVRIERRPDENLYVYTTLNWIGYRQELISADEKGELRRYQGEWSLSSNSGGSITPKVNAPYRTLKFRHRKLPYILDDAGVYFK